MLLVKTFTVINRVTNSLLASILCYPFKTDIVFFGWCLSQLWHSDEKSEAELSSTLRIRPNTVTKDYSYTVHVLHVGSYRSLSFNFCSRLFYFKTFKMMMPGRSPVLVLSKLIFEDKML